MREYYVARAEKSITIYPKETYSWTIPAEVLHCDQISVNPRRQDGTWFQPKVMSISPEGRLDIVNIRDEPIRLTRGKVFAEIRTCKENDVNKVRIHPDDP